MAHDSFLLRFEFWFPFTAVVEVGEDPVRYGRGTVRRFLYGGGEEYIGKNVWPRCSAGCQ